MASGTYSAESSPFNLDLSIYDPQNNLVFSDVGTLDNLRKADILLPSNGYYQVRLTNTTSRSGRYYAMAFELLEPLEGDFNADSIVDTADMIALANNWLADNRAAGQVCYLFDLTADGRIDIQDMTVLSKRWLSIDPCYYPVP